MKNIIKVLIILISLLFGVTTTGVAAELTPSNVTIGKDGFKFLNTNNDSSDIFLKKNEMLPGDSTSGKLTIFNDLKEPFKVYFTARRLSGNQDIDLGKVIHISIKDGNKYVFNGTLTKEDGTVNNMYLGIVNPGEEKVFNVEATLDPKATDNKYKNKKIEDEWIFTAVGTKDNKEISSIDDGINNSTKNLEKIVQKVKGFLPKTGYDHIAILLVGLIIVVVGIFLLLNKKKENKDGVS